MNKDMSISDAELQRMTAGGVHIGDSVSGSIDVKGVSLQSSSSVGSVKLVASGQSKTVKFMGVASTFQSLQVQAGNGVDVGMDVSTVAGAMELVGDADDVSTTGVAFADQVALGADRTLSSSTLMTLAATSGGIVASGHAVTLKARQGMYIASDLSSAAPPAPCSDPCGSLVLNADSDSAGSDGTLTVATATTVRTNGGDMRITAWDLDLQGSMSSTISSGLSPRAGSKLTLM